MDFTVELIKYPTDDDWMFCKICTLNTVGKTSTKLPTDEWKHKLLMSEHSPIRTLWFGFKLVIPYYVSVHISRHFMGATHFVQTQRNDRQDNYDRTKAPQDTLVSHILYINAQELMYMSRRRLCTQADPFTRAVMHRMQQIVENQCDEFIDTLEPMCSYRGGRCTEFNCCGLNKKYIIKYGEKDAAALDADAT